MTNLNLKKLAFIAIFLPIYFVITSYSTGIFGYSTSASGGCSCHGVSDPNTNISISPNTAYTLNQVHTFTITMVNASQLHGGFNLTTNIGTITPIPGEDTQANGALELTHTAKKDIINKTASWTFNWTAPASGNTPLQFLIAGNAVNGDGGTGGDQWNFGTIAAIPLPLKFVDFTVNKIDQGIKLKWSIEDVVNVSHFEIQKSFDGKNFETIGSEKLSKNSTYFFIDKNQKNGLAYYRIRSVDYDGESGHSEIVSLKISDKLNLNIFPSIISDGIINIQNLENIELNYEFQLFDLSGKLVTTSNIDLNQLDVSNITKGTYIINILSNNQSVFNRKIFIL